jgi:hypothetical protein
LRKRQGGAQVRQQDKLHDISFSKRRGFDIAMMFDFASF